MLRSNIPKFFAFVIVICAIFSGCSTVSSGVNDNKPKGSAGSGQYGEAKVLGTIRSDEIGESSGLAASKCNTEAFWTHNDSGDKNFIYAISKSGEKLGTWRVEGATNYDWEEIASYQTAQGDCFLYIADIGNNERLRSEFVVYRLPEPSVTAGARSSNRRSPQVTQRAEAFKFSYSDIRHDAEAMFVHPGTGEIYILTKRVIGASGVYKLDPGKNTGKAQNLKKLADLSVPALPNGMLTGADISPDGKRVIVCDYFAAYELVLSETAKTFDDIWKADPARIELGKREQGEAIAYSADGKSIYATSEKRNSPLIMVSRSEN